LTGGDFSGVTVSEGGRIVTGETVGGRLSVQYANTVVHAK